MSGANQGERMARDSWQARAVRSIAGGCLTFSKSRRYYVEAQPSHVTDADGNYLIETDGRLVLDTVSGLGANLVECRNSLSLPTTAEVELAERLIHRIPLWKDGRVKIVKTGTEACMSALKFARAYANRRRNENMQEVSTDKRREFVSQRQDVLGRNGEVVQGVRERVSEFSKGDGDKAIGTEAVCKNRARKDGGKKILPQKVGTHCGIGEKQGVQHCENEVVSESVCCVRGASCGGASRGLLETVGCDMAMSNSPCSKACGIGIGTGYHGHANEFIGAEPNSIGVVHSGYFKMASLGEVVSAVQEYGDIIDYVIVEPVELDANVKHELQALRAACDSSGTVLIFDEVITGCRWHNFTVSQDFGVTPDLLVLGKALGGGCPLGIVMGPASIMDIEGVFVSGTFAGEQSALYSALDVLDECSDSRINMFWEQCQDFHRKMSYHCAGKMEIPGYGTRMVFKSPQDDGLTVAKYMQEMYTRHKILIGPVMFPKVGWTSREYSKVLDATIDVVKDIDKVELIGPKPRPMFKR